MTKPTLDDFRSYVVKVANPQPPPGYAGASNAYSVPVADVGMPPRGNWPPYPSHAEHDDGSYEPVEKPGRHALKTIGTGLGSMALGFMAGGLGGHLADIVATKVTGKPIPVGTLVPAASLVAAATAAAATMYHDRHLRELQRAHRSWRDKPRT